MRTRMPRRRFSSGRRSRSCSCGSIDHVAIYLGVSFFTVMQRNARSRRKAAVAAVLYFLMTRFVPAREVRRILLVGICFNRSRFSISVQHENIDVFVGLFVMLGTVGPRLRRPRRAMPWGGSRRRSPFGLGVFVKTVPLALMPLLAPGMRRASKLGRWLVTRTVLSGQLMLSLAVMSSSGRTPSSTTSSATARSAAIRNHRAARPCAPARASLACTPTSSRFVLDRRPCSCSSACSGTAAWTRGGRSCSRGSCSPAIPVIGPGYALRSTPTGSCRRSSRVIRCSTIGWRRILLAGVRRRRRDVHGRRTA